MKRETYANKLNELLGITKEVSEVQIKLAAKKGRIIGITEEEIAVYREREAVKYFLQAPGLFHSRVCSQCGAPFLVSRLHVSTCSYECINRYCTENFGVSWSRANDLELAVKEVWGGNEPLIIKNLSTLQKALEKILETQNTLANT